MSALETEFFNLLETSESRWTALFIEGRTWFNVEVQRSAWQAQMDRMKAQGAGFAKLRRSDSDENEASATALEVEPVDHEETWCLWVTPEKRRAKFEVGDELVDVVFEGPTFWSNGQGRSITNGGKANYGHGQGDGQNLIRTAEYSRLVRVAELSEGMRIGRHTIEAKVTILNDKNRKRGQGLHGLTIGDAELLELSVDRERGVVLSASSRFHGVIYRTLEIERVAFDPNFDLDVFKIEPEFGAHWVSTN
jgi:hypothetical protein